MKMAPLTLPQVAEAKEWIADCEWGDLDPDDALELTYAQIIRGLQRHFDGGIHGYLVSFEF